MSILKAYVVVTFIASPVPTFELVLSFVFLQANLSGSTYNDY